MRMRIRIWIPNTAEMERAGAGECDDINHPPVTVRYVTVFFLRLMSAHLVILGRVIPSSPPLDMKQYRYKNVDKSHPLILNYH
jgi:hypothetical protein